MDAATISFPIFGDGFIINVPRYIEVFGFRLYLYGLFITAGFFLAALYLIRRHETVGLTKDNVLDLVIMAVPCGLVGARLYYILFNFNQYFGPGKWQNILMFREGGLAVYGGVIGGAIAFFIYSRIKKIHYGKLLDAAGFGLFIGQAVGRWGNFFNREAYGIQTEVPWRMGLTTGVRTIYVHPAFLYEMLWNVCGLILMHIYSRKTKAKYHGQYFLFYVAWYGFGRFLIEGIRTDSLYVWGTDIRASQLLAALSFAAAVVLLIRNHKIGLRSRGDEGNSELLDGGNSEFEIRDSELTYEGNSELTDVEDIEDAEDIEDDESVEDAGDSLETEDNLGTEGITEKTGCFSGSGLPDDENLELLP